MKLFQVCEPLEVVKCNLSGSTFSDVNLSDLKLENIKLTDARLEDINATGLAIRNANLTNASIVHCNFTGMTINGILVTDLLAAYRASQATTPTDPTTELSS